VGLSVWCSSVSRQLPHAGDVEAKSSRLLKIYSAGVSGGKVTDYCLHRFSEFGEKVKYWRIYYAW
jgi:hypothetical protein